MEEITTFFNKEFYQNSILDWAISFGIILGAILVAKILYWITGKFVKRAASKTKSNLDDLLVDKLEEPVVYAVALETRDVSNACVGSPGSVSVLGVYPG